MTAARACEYVCVSLNNLYNLQIVRNPNWTPPISYLGPLKDSIYPLQFPLILWTSSGQPPISYRSLKYKTESIRWTLFSKLCCLCCCQQATQWLSCGHGSLGSVGMASFIFVRLQVCTSNKSTCSDSSNMQHIKKNAKQMPNNANPTTHAKYLQN